MSVPRSLFRCGFAIESIASLLMIEQISQLEDKIGARARSARVGNTLYFANVPGIFYKKLCVNRISKPSGKIFGLTGC